MGKVIYVTAMSLDGFITGENVRPEAGLGDGGERLHEWANSSDPRNQKIMASWGNIGAIITGRTTYNLSIPYWGADGPMRPACQRLSFRTAYLTMSLPAACTRS